MTITPYTGPRTRDHEWNVSTHKHLEDEMSQQIRVRVRRPAARRAPLSELDLRTPSGRLLPY
jgi:hypothetical protein